MTANYLGADELEFELGTDEPFAVGVKQTFERFSDAAKEDGRSRIYLGVHYEWDADMAYVGTRLADHIFDTLLAQS